MDLDCGKGGVKEKSFCNYINLVKHSLNNLFWLQVLLDIKKILHPLSQLFIRLAEFSEFLFYLGKTPLCLSFCNLMIGIFYLVAEGFGQCESTSREL